MNSMLMPEVGDDDSEMIKQLMKKLHEIEEKSQILILLLMSWSIKRIEI